MDLFIFFIQLIFTIPLFCILEYFDKKKITNVQKILIPSIYIIILSGLCCEIKSNIYLIVLFEVLLHNFYTNRIVNKELLINKKEYFINSLFSICLSIFMYEYYISKVSSIFPMPEEFRSLLWFLIIIFVYNLFKETHIKTNTVKKSNFIDRKREYVVVMYAKLKNKYYKAVKSKEMFINRFTYSVMIYENYKNPYFYRKFNNFMNRFVNKEMKYGIMQVESDKEITDEKSIKLYISKIEKDYSKLSNKLNDSEKISSLLQDKNSEYVKDVIDIYNEINEFENR